MPREYRHIKEYEKEILELKEQGLTLRAIGEQLGFTYKQLHNFITRHNSNQRKLSAGIIIKPKGRPRKDGTKLPPSSQQLSKVMTSFEAAEAVCNCIAQNVDNKSI